MNLKFDLVMFIVAPPFMAGAFVGMFTLTDNPIWQVVNLVIAALWLLGFAYGLLVVLPAHWEWREIQREKDENR